MQTIFQSNDTEILKELFKQLFMNSTDPLFIADDTFRFIETNKAFENLFKKNGTISQREHLIDLFEKQKSFLPVLKLINEGGIVNNLKVTFEDFEGERVFALLSLVAIFNDKDLLGYQGIIHDETELVMAQKKLERAQKFALTARMLRTIAHEVRNPLTNVCLAIANLKDSSLNPEDFQMIELIDRNATRINDLISELLDSSRPAELELVDISLRELVEETLVMAKDRMKLKEINLLKNFNHHTDLIKADVPKIKLALNNIIINAIESMQVGGTLSLDVKQSSKKIRLSIQDSGKGMNQETLDHLFDPFFTSKESGTGLGLTAVQNIIDSHGWSIDVDSEVGEGSTFHIYIIPESNLEYPAS